MSRLFLDPLRAALPGKLCSISPTLWAVSLRMQAAGVPTAVPSSAFADALNSATRDAAP